MTEKASDSERQITTDIQISTEIAELLSVVVRTEKELETARKEQRKAGGNSDCKRVQGLEGKIERLKNKKYNLKGTRNKGKGVSEGLETNKGTEKEW